MGKGDDATLGVIGLSQQTGVNRDGIAPMPMPAITAWSRAQAVSVATGIDLDLAGMPRKLNAPFGPVRSGHRGAC
ncbi:hypothetical protein [Azohydromonas aeria]|uniref:hypothetical protein n=1 Tax=Azohydromonas aeria TaxID=2590212 RepID=UPI0012FCD74C|nr:hypothetical protein [Azohydromonas aeria]